MLSSEQRQTTGQRQSMSLGSKQLQSLGLLMKSLPELRMEITRAISENPVLEDIDHPLETPLSVVERSNDQSENDATPDYPDDNYDPPVGRDEDAAERRQAFFDNQVKSETLQDHLLVQLPLSGIDESDWPLVMVLVGDLDDSGFYRGSIPDACMAFSRSEDEVRALLRRLTEFDPPGCGATTARECLLAQLDVLNGSPYREAVRKMIDRHLPDIASGDHDQVAAALKLDRTQYAEALKALRSLSASPGASFPGERDRVEYVNPEVHAIKVRGKWYADTDKRSLPEIRVSRRYLEMLRDPNQSEETKRYVRERIAAANALREAVVKRQETIESIAQATFDRQQEFFSRGFPALKPLTESEIARAVGVDVATVSRTVCGKYASTPFGTVELRRFFIAEVKTGSGESFSQAKALETLKAIVDAEDKAKPLSDVKIAERMAAAGFPLARRTIAKYRETLNIPGTAERKKAS